MENNSRGIPVNADQNSGGLWLIFRRLIEGADSPLLASVGEGVCLSTDVVDWCGLYWEDKLGNIYQSFK